MSDSIFNRPQEDFDALNRVAIKEALGYLYQTHVIDERAAELRGSAVRAVAAFADALDIRDTIKEMEAVPHSQRLRESALWRAFRSEQGEE